MTMKNIYKYMLSFMVMMVALNLLYIKIPMPNMKLYYENAEKDSHEHLQSFQKNARATFHKRYDVDSPGMRNDSILQGLLEKYHLQFKDNPFPSRVQRFLTTVVHLTKARQNVSLWSQLDLMNLSPFSFDPAFHNPCWWSSTPASHPCDSQQKMLVPESLLSSVKRYSNLNTHKKSFFRCLPYFYVIGQGKSGTTDLFGKIKEHPSVFTGAKETQWICRKRLGHRACPSIDTYIDMFHPGAEHILRNHQNGSTNPYITGEGTPGYFSYNDFWDLLPGNEDCKDPCVTNADIIHHITPGAKLIIILRNPTDRLYSHYFHKHGLLHRPTSREYFHHLVVKEIGKFQHCLKSQTLRNCCYNYTITDSLTEEMDLRRGIYHVFLSDWLKVFPRNQIHIVKFEDYVADGSKQLRNIFKFLNIRDIPEENLALMFQGPPANRRRPEVKRRVGEMWNSTRNILDRFYKPFSLRLSTLLKDDNFFW